jgi:alpha-galactosidase
MSKRTILSAAFLFFLPLISFAQNKNLILIETKNSALVFTEWVNAKLYQIYFGEELDNNFDYLKNNSGKEDSYSTYGNENLFTPAIRITHTDGNPSLDLRYISHQTEKIDSNVMLTKINLKDPKYPVSVILNFKTFYNEDVIEEWTEIEHHEKDSIILYNFASSQLNFNAEHYWLTQFHGDWAREMQMQESELTSGIKIIDSKLGTRADMFQTPVFFLSLNKPSDENNGELIAGTLAWTGNFQFLFEIDPKNSLKIISGMNPFASEYKLKPDEKFVTPKFIFTFSNQGKGKASRSLHKWARKYDILDGEKPRLTLLNNWESTGFDFNETKLSNLIKDTKKLRVDLFLLDDGWFGNKYPRNDDHAGLGDWQPNKAKLPDGISYLTKEADKNGVKFGIWLEPEMVNPKSELYEKHPEWILRFPNRDEKYFRNQLVLDLTNPEVQDFVSGILDNLLTKNPDIAFIKWDCNSMIVNPYSPYLKDKQSHLYIDYVKGLYNVLKRFREKYPNLPVMLCSGGGGRVDYEALKYFTEFWPSDNTDGYNRVFIQWGYSYFFPSIAMCAHVTSMGDQSLKFRTDVAMMGKLGYDIPVEKMSDEELKFSQQAVKNYKKLSNIIWFGDLYRLISPYKEKRAVLMYVNDQKNKAALFAYNLQTQRQNFEPVKLQGLVPDKNYNIEEINLYPGMKGDCSDSGKIFSGEYLMNVGLNVSSNKSLTSSVVEITETN